MIFCENIRLYDVIPYFKRFQTPEKHALFSSTCAFLPRPLSNRPHFVTSIVRVVNLYRSQDSPVLY